jgi:superfamily II DNA/RNA helicase
MHSDLSQQERDSIMYEFRNHRINILIATDIVSRGIDIDDIQLVINYDVPHDPEDYVHRIGRTARANRQGSAITFVTPSDYVNLIKIEKLIGNKIPESPLPADCGTRPTISKKPTSRKHQTSKSHASDNRHRQQQHKKRRVRSSNEPINK